MTDEHKEEVLEMLRLDRRRNNSIQQWAIVIALGVQFATFVWQAAKIAATQEAQQVWQMEFRSGVTSLTNSVASLATQVAVNSNNIAIVTRSLENKK